MTHMYHMIALKVIITEMTCSPYTDYSTTAISTQLSTKLTLMKPTIKLAVLARPDPYTKQFKCAFAPRVCTIYTKISNGSISTVIE